MSVLPFPLPFARSLTVYQHVTTGADAKKNFLVVDGKTDTATIESTFDSFIERKDIAIVLINQHASSYHVLLQFVRQC